MHSSRSTLAEQVVSHVDENVGFEVSVHTRKARHCFEVCSKERAEGLAVS